MVAWYKFDEATNIGLNSSPYGLVLNATINVTPTLDSSKYITGSSSYFSGAGDDDSLIIDNNSNKLYTYLNQKPITIAFWCWSVSEGELSNGRIFYGAPTGLANNINSLQCFHRDSNQLAITITFENTAEFDNNTLNTTQMPAFNTAWSHVVIIIEPQSTNWTTKEHNVSIYINGVLDVTKVMYYPKITENYDFQIGRWTTNEDSR